MPAIRGLTVAVGQWYADTLAITLPRNMRHMTECVVVTAPGDPSIAVAESVPGVIVSTTDAFTRHGALFNKGLAIEEAGFDFMGRDGWIWILDADILLPPTIPFDRLRPEHLHGARRRVLDDPKTWHPEMHWGLCPLVRDGGPIGFSQLFHADAPDLANVRPWYDVSFAHAGGGDAAFMSHFHPNRRVTLPMDVLHLGPIDRHWFGLTPEAKDTMAAFVHRNGWRRAMVASDPTAVDRVAHIPERVDVPGYPPSTFELPFVRRAREQA